MHLEEGVEKKLIMRTNLYDLFLRSRTYHKYFLGIECQIYVRGESKKASLCTNDLFTHAECGILGVTRLHKCIYGMQCISRKFMEFATLQNKYRSRLIPNVVIKVNKI